MSDKTIVNLIRGGIAVVILAILGFSCSVVVPVGYSAVHTRFGNPVGEYQPGLNFKLPIIDGAVKMSTRDEKTKFETEVSSKDIQTIKIDSAVIVALDPTKVVNVYTKYRKEYMDTVVMPLVAETLNDEVAKFPIEDFIENKPIISTGVKEVVNSKLANTGIMVKDFVIVGHDFSDDFDKSIEAKKISQQRAEKAKFDLERVTLEAEAQKRKQSSLTQAVLMEQFIQKWDGHLPQIITGSGSNLLMNLPMPKTPTTK